MVVRWLGVGEFVSAAVGYGGLVVDDEAPFVGPCERVVDGFAADGAGGSGGCPSLPVALLLGGVASDHVSVLWGG